PKPRPDRLVILGDSGCRLKGAAVQHCNDPTGWPFARVAALAAARRPDLVIHVGDYYYRETPCPAREAACAGSPFGDRWATWKAELFDPAQPLLAAAPWVFARGNHEDCKRGGAGWFRLLDAAARPKACPARSDTFAVDLGGLKLFVVDSADTNDILALAGATAAFAGGLNAVAGRDRREPAWIVTHRPIWDAIRFGDILSDGVVNATERAAVRERDLAGIALILSGHVHNFTALGFGEARPAQLVVGTGGDLMSSNDVPPPATGQVKIDGLAARVFTMGRFGYFVFDRQGKDWVGAFHDLTDAVAATCRLHGRDLSCVPGR
ncbi:MAG: metallophosphoesterase, partial [Pseudomonadota bacterium]